MTIKVLFVCLGNICRSPMAEAVFTRMLEDEGLQDCFEVDSAGTGDWHIGQAPCAGTQKVLARKGIEYHGRARQVTSADLADPATYVLAMDTQNLRDLRRDFGNRARMNLLLDFATKTKEKNVPDPYYEGGFEHVYELIEDGCLGLLAALRTEEKL